MTPDYVLVGAGAAGCVLAARLTEDPSVRVLLLEAGRERRHPLAAMPAAEVLFMGDPRFDWRFETEPDPTADGRRLAIPRGRLLGGSNVINGMVFVRGQAADYDDWAAAGNAGWGWDGVLPAFRRLERTTGLDPAVRGTDGPIDVTEMERGNEVCERFLAAARDLGYRDNPDYNSGDQEGIGHYQATVRDGRRVSALGTYLAAARRRPNLEIVTGATVTSLRLDGTRCVGVRYRRGGTTHDAGCAREVILCAGTVQSPQLLELSGIGAAGVLRRAGVPQRHDLPGVGENLRDHYAARLRWRVTRPGTLNDRTRGVALLREAVRYLRHGEGLLAGPIARAYAFLRSAPGEPRPDLQFHITPGSYGPGSSRRFDRLPGMTVGVYPARPESTGSVHVTSPDPDRPPSIAPRFLDAEPDRRRLLAGIRLARAIAAGPAMDPVRGPELTPGPDAVSDDDLLAYARERGDTSYHPVGTCRMGRDPGAVVDERLRVRGLHGLRVVDASVMPTMVSGNTNAAALMIGEKGAELVLADHAAARAGATGGPAR